MELHILIAVISSLALTIHGFPADVQNGPTENSQSVVPGVFISVDTLKNLQDQALQNNPERNNEGNQATTNSEHDPISQPISPNQVSIPQPGSEPINQELELVNQQPSIAPNSLQVLPSQQDLINQQLMNQQPIRPNQQQIYMGPQRQFVQQLPINQQMLPNQQQLLVTQQQMLPNQQYIADQQQPLQRNQQQYLPNQQPFQENQQQYVANQQPFQGNQQQYLANQQPFHGNQQQYLANQQPIQENQPQYLENQQPIQGNQQQYLANQQQLTYQQPMYLNQQQIPNQQDQVWQNGQPQPGYIQQNQQIPLNQGQSTLLAVNPISNGQILAAKPVNLEPLNQNQGSMLYAILPINNGQNAMPARNIDGNSLLVPYQQVPSNQVYSY